MDRVSPSGRHARRKKDAVFGAREASFFQNKELEEQLDVIGVRFETTTGVERKFCSVAARDFVANALTTNGIFRGAYRLRIDSDFVPTEGHMKEGRCIGANAASFFLNKNLVATRGKKGEQKQKAQAVTNQ